MSHRHRHKCVVATLLLSADLNETGENAEERDEVFPSLRRKMTHRWSCRSSHNSLQLGSSLSVYYGIPILQRLRVLSTCVCVLWRLLLLSFRDGEILINHIWL